MKLFRYIRMLPRRTKATLFLFSITLVSVHSLSTTSSSAVLRTSVCGDLFPIIGFTVQSRDESRINPDADSLERFSEQPTFASLGFSIVRDPFSMVMIIEAQRDFGQWLQDNNMLNLPLPNDDFNMSLGTLYPQIGYIDGAGDGWHVSAGRRVISVGPSISVSLAVSQFNPWYDHLLAGIFAPLGSRSIGYDGLAIGVRRIARDNIESSNGIASLGGKILLLHRVSFESPVFSFGIGEYNLLAGVTQDMEDMNPFLKAHHLFATGSNEMLQFDFSYNPNDRLRIYGEILMDDFQSASESKDLNPTAMGFSVGTEYRLKYGQRNVRSAFFRKDYGIRLGEPPLSGGLILRFESALASTYLYRRNAQYSDQIISTQYYIRTTSDLNSVTINSFFANPLGPDRIRLALTLSEDSRKLNWSLGTFATFLGAESDGSLYEFPYRSSWLGPQLPITVEYGVSAKSFFSIDENSGILTAIEQGYREETGFKTGLSIGFVQRFSRNRSPSVND